MTEPLTGMPAHLWRGQRAEAWGRRYLEAHGLQFLAANERCAAGELDLVMTLGDTVVFVEVRYRSSDRFGGAAASVGSAKQRRLRAAAETWLQRHPNLAARPCRFDVLAITGCGHDIDVRWLTDAF